VGPELGRMYGPSRLRGASAALSIPSSKEERMSRNALYVRLVFIVLVLSTIALVLGEEPWGPN